jgi:YD repeat-containing protein
LNGTYPNYTGIVGSPAQQEDFGYDATGNWASCDSLSPANSQTRTHSVANEITEITEITSAAGTVTPSYSLVCNMTTLPINPGLSTSQYTLTWDAWNRLISVKNGSTTLASYAYDGLSRRITKTTATETRQYYYNDAWRTLEERVNF